MKFIELREDLQLFMPVYSKEQSVLSGVYKNYHMTMKVQKQTKRSILALSIKQGDVIPSQDLRKFLDELKAKSKFILRIEYQDFKLSLHIRHPKTREETTATLSTLIDEIITFLKENHYISCCEHCGKDRNMKPYELNEQTLIICNTCYKDLDQQLAFLREKTSEENGNFFTGCIGAIMGCFIGIGIWILFHYLNLLPTISAILLPFCVLKGYIICHGRNKNIYFFLLCITMLLVILCIQYVCFAWDIHEVLNEELSISLKEAIYSVPNYLAIAEIQIDFIANLMSCYFMMGVTSLFMIRHMKRDKSRMLMLYPLEHNDSNTLVL